MKKCKICKQQRCVFFFFFLKNCLYDNKGNLLLQKKKKKEKENEKKKRVREDSNPRYLCRHAGFQDRFLQPLRHLPLFFWAKTHLSKKHFSILFVFRKKKVKHF